MGKGVCAAVVDVEGPETEERRACVDEAGLEELIAAKRARLAALEAEHEDYKRVRAHLGDLMSHNRSSMEKTADELQELEGLRHAAGRIRSAIERG